MKYTTALLFIRERYMGCYRKINKRFNKEELTMEVKEITDVKAREMSFQELQLEAGKCIKKLELLGPTISRLCPPATAISAARRTFS